MLEGLEKAHEAEEEQLEGQPLAGPDSVQDHVGRDLEEHNSQREHLLADIELVLVDADILHELVCNGICNVSSVKLQAEEPKGQDRHDDEVQPAKDSISKRSNEVELMWIEPLLPLGLALLLLGPVDLLVE